MTAGQIWEVTYAKMEYMDSLDLDYELVSCLAGRSLLSTTRLAYRVGRQTFLPNDDPQLILVIKIRR